MLGKGDSGGHQGRQWGTPKEGLEGMQGGQLAGGGLYLRGDIGGLYLRGSMGVSHFEVRSG